MTSFDNEGSCGCSGGRGEWVRNLYFLLNFAVNLKLKNSLYIKKKQQQQPWHHFSMPCFLPVTDFSEAGCISIMISVTWKQKKSVISWTQGIFISFPPKVQSKCFQLFQEAHITLCLNYVFKAHSLIKSFNMELCILAALLLRWKCPWWRETGKSKDRPMNYWGCRQIADLIHSIHFRMSWESRSLQLRWHQLLPN